MTIEMPPARKYSNACQLMKLLDDHGFETRLVGGCVRDRHLGLEPYDYDLTSKALPEEVTKICRDAKLKVIPTGLEHGTVSVLIQNHTFEVTTLRQDVATDGRRAKVKFGSSFFEDAARRDFTMNAMSEDRNGKVYDYFEGMRHLREKRIVFVGDPATRISEDYLRILRFFRFKARFFLQADPATLAAVAQGRSGLGGISQERITTELLGLFSCQAISPTFADLVGTGVFATLFPSLAVTADSPLLTLQDALDRLAPAQRALGRLAACLVLGSLPWRSEADFADKLEAVAEGLRLSRRDRASLLMACLGIDALPLERRDRASLFDLIDRCEVAGGADAFSAFYEPFWQILAPAIYSTHDDRLAAVQRSLAALWQAEASASHIRRQVLPVSGKEVMEWTGLAAGPELGQTMNTLKRLFRNGQWQTAEQAKALVEQGLPAAE